MTGQKPDAATRTALAHLDRQAQEIDVQRRRIADHLELRRDAGMDPWLSQLHKRAAEVFRETSSEWAPASVIDALAVAVACLIDPGKARVRDRVRVRAARILLDDAVSIGKRGNP
jgi:hypothetical protein